MRRIQLWTVDGSPKSGAHAQPIDEVSETETEQQLEDLLVSSAKTLLDGVNLIGRQLPTEGGPLDLVGVDPDGNLVIFELKRGTLTREAVAQILDYASDLAKKDPKDFARLIERSSGKAGIDRFDDFLDWYSQQYPDADQPLAEPPRMILVGLGVDGRATRIVNFLAAAGIDIQLLTFHAFRCDGRLMLARQVETQAPAQRAPTKGQTKEGNLRQLLELAEHYGSKSLLVEMAEFIEARMPCYRWPGKSAVSFSLQGRTEEGNPSWHVYVALYVDQQRHGAVRITFPPRADSVAPEGMAKFVSSVPGAKRVDSSWAPIEASVDATTWEEVKPQLEQALCTIVEGWRGQQKAQDKAESEKISGEETEHELA